jgi:hypothetical protein
MAGASFANCVFSHTFLRSAKMKGASFQSSIIDDCDIAGAEIEKTDFRSTKIIETDLWRAKVTSIHLEGADLEAAFGSYLAYVVKAVKTDGPSPHNAEEILKIYKLFKVATWDDSTVISQAARDAIDLMTQT